VSIADDITQEVRKSLGVAELTIAPDRRSRRAAVPSRRVYTHAEREAFHARAEEREQGAIRKANATRLRQYAADVDAVLKAANLLSTFKNDKESVEVERVAVVTGLPFDFCDKVIETKWAGTIPNINFTVADE
jgi:hypothetical protein